jgi:hypothetical protein
VIGLSAAYPDETTFREAVQDTGIGAIHVGRVVVVRCKEIPHDFLGGEWYRTAQDVALFVAIQRRFAILSILSSQSRRLRSTVLFHFRREVG